MTQKDKAVTLPTFAELEEQIFALEGIRVVFRTTQASETIPRAIGPEGYPFERKASDAYEIEYLYDRIWRTLGRPAEMIEVTIIDGYGQAFPLRLAMRKRRQSLGKLRKTYQPRPVK